MTHCNFKNSLLFFLLMLTFNETYAQNEDEALKFAQTNVLGTARCAAVGGAFGALGADLSCFSINPAGIGLYRKAEFGISLSGVGIANESQMFQNSNLITEKASNIGINTLGIVGTIQSIDESGWVSINYGFAYNKIKDFNNSYHSIGINNENSITDFFAKRAGRYTEDELNQNLSFKDQWAQPAYQNGLIMLRPDYNPNDDSYYMSVLEFAGQEQIKYKITSGNLSEYAFAITGNYENKIYIGAALSITNISYKETKKFSENKIGENNDPVFDQYLMNYDEEYDVAGSGYNFKLGLIYAPIHSIRMGFSLQTPTFYDLTTNYSGNMSSEFTLFDPLQKSIHKSPRDEYRFDYQYKTPIKLTASLAYIFAKKAFISLDYDYLNYGNSTFNSDSDPFTDVNLIVNSQYIGVSNLRIGTEYKITNFLSLRLGYSLNGNPYENTQVQKNGKERLLSAGFGLQIGKMFFDFAYIKTNLDETDIFYKTSLEGKPSGSYISKISNRGIISFSYKF